MTAHAKLSASGAHRWAVCAGSVKAEDGLPDKSSSFANEGSAAHELAELALANSGSTHVYMDKPLLEWNEFSPDQAMCDYVQQYVDYVKNLGGEQFYEIRVNFSDWVPEGFGTSDAIVMSGTTLHIVDLKYGQGLRVDADDNLQAILYALGAYSEMSLAYDIHAVRVHIVQPRLDHISVWEISANDLLRRGEQLRQAAEATQADDAPRVPGEKQCQWCKAKARCPALKAHTESIIASDFDNLDMANPDSLSDGQLAQAMGNKKLIVAWLDAVESHIKERLNDGDTFPGYKLVSGRSSRKWIDEGDATKALIDIFDVADDSLYTVKLITPPQAEKLVGKKHKVALSEYIAVQAGAPTLAPESDKRPAININDDDFNVCN